MVATVGLAGCSETFLMQHVHASCDRVPGLVTVVEYLVILGLFFYYTQIE